MTRGWVLMYHRVCPRGPDTACWFARGTAVTPEIFEAQMRWVMDRFEVVSLTDLVLRPAARERPRVALTFDDGYREILRVVAPICHRLGVTGACFASAAPPLLGQPLWFDAWYAAVQAGRELPRWLGHLRSLGITPPGDLDGWINGPPKKWLAGLDVVGRGELLREIGRVAGAQFPADSYLSVVELRELSSLGWELGGHGLHHLRLSDCHASAAEHEIAASVELLERAGAGPARIFSYPDGAWTPDVARMLARSGFVLACTATRAPWTGETDPMAVPRLFCRGDSPVPHPVLSAAVMR